MENASSSLLMTPKAKKRCRFTRDYPFPITGNDVENAPSPDQEWNCFVGHLQEDCVLIVDESSMKTLFRMGFYGKGTLSRSAPAVLFGKRKHLMEKRKTNSENIGADEESILQNESEDEEIEVVDSDDDFIKGKSKKKKEEIEVVLSDSDSSSSTQKSTSESQSSVEKENLQLSFEEAYFLSYGLGCLVVKDKEQPLDLTRLWHKFCDLSGTRNFPVMYTAYHHFRSKGWIVRHGLKYGVDYVLYKDGPPFYHSTYAVVVKPVKEQNLREINIGGRQSMTWSSLSALNRICTHASKGLLFLYVIKPNAMSENKISTPYCISQYKLEEVLLNRWVPSENREENA